MNRKRFLLAMAIMGAAAGTRPPKVSGKDGWWPGGGYGPCALWTQDVSLPFPLYQHSEETDAQFKSRIKRTRA